MKQLAKTSKLFILGERTSKLFPKLVGDISQYSIYYMPRTYNIFDVMKFSPDIIFDQATEQYVDCRRLN